MSGAATPPVLHPSYREDLEKSGPSGATSDETDPVTATATLPALYPDHQAYLEARGITPQTIAANGPHSARPQDLIRFAGRPVLNRTSGLVFPYPPVDGEEPFFRVRWFPPLQDRDGHAVKFTQPAGMVPRLYVPQSVRPILADPGVPLWMVEGETRALVCVQHGRHAIAIGGLWSWLANGRPIPDLGQVAWVDREVTLGVDSDVWSRPDLLQAAYALGKELEARGAKVKIIVLRPAPDGCKRGLDDFVAAEGPEALDRLVVILLTHKAFSKTAAWWKRWREQKDAAANDSQTAPVSLVEDVKPWLDPVDGATVLEKLVAAVRRFVVLPPPCGDGVGALVPGGAWV